MPDGSKAPDKPRQHTSAVRKTVERVFPGGRYTIDDPKWRWSLIIGTSLVAAFLMAPHSFRVYNLTLGEPARETIVSPITFRVVDEAATSKNRDDVLRSTLPVYDFDDEMVHDVQDRIRNAFNSLREYLAAAAAKGPLEPYKTPESPPEPEVSKAPAEAPRFRPIDDKSLRAGFENLLGVSVSPPTFFALKAVGFNPRVETDLRSLVVPVLLKGVVLSRELVVRDGKRGILLRIRSKDKLEQLKDLSLIFDLKEAENFINTGDTLSQSDLAGDPPLAQEIRKLATALVDVNITYNRDKSAGLREAALAAVKPVYFQVSKGEPIIKKGEPANEGHLKKLAGLNIANPAYSQYMIFGGFSLMLALLMRLCFYFAEQHLNRARSSTRDILLFCILLIGTIVLVRFVSWLGTVIPNTGRGMGPHSILFAAPVATGAMLVALMVDARIAFIFAVLAAMAASLTVEGDLYIFAFYLVAGIVGLHGMTRTLDRTSVLRAGLVVGLANMLVILSIKMSLGSLNHIQDFYETGLGFLGGIICGVLVSGFAPLLEPLGYTTNVRLLELANFNHPLLKAMALEAPGTYHHSIMVGNLVEAAAESIGANPLLARVGAYYHDIGKVGSKTKPSYFIENQGRGPNPHDKLEPSMSALILVAHVKHGVEKARDHRLGAPIIDIIQQHHGTSLIKFFYNKALERANKNHQTVSDDKYHYPGPRPQSKEAALVMLADVVEAACRTLTDPTPARIQKRVQELIMSLFSEGELDQSNLTLKDLHAITRSFVRALQGIMHARIDYPSDNGAQEKQNGDLHRLPTEKDRHRPGRAPDEGGKNIRRLGL